MGCGHTLLSPQQGPAVSHPPPALQAMRHLLAPSSELPSLSFLLPPIPGSLSPQAWPLPGSQPLLAPRHCRFPDSSSPRSQLLVLAPAATTQPQDPGPPARTLRGSLVPSGCSQLLGQMDPQALQTCDPLQPPSSPRPSPFPAPSPGTSCDGLWRPARPGHGHLPAWAPLRSQTHHPHPKAGVAPAGGSCCIPLPTIIAQLSQ